MMGRTYTLQKNRAQPVLKWVGGKGQLLSQLTKLTPHEFAAYHEPFVGGGALFFELAAQGKIRKAYLSDINQSLIDVYIAVRDYVDDVISILKNHRYEENYFYAVRSLDPQKLSCPERAARIIFLNKTCFNGLYRENLSGEFNVPFGRYKNPTICDEPNLRAASEILQIAQIECRHYSVVLDRVQSDDFVYFDPPYYPISLTSNFTSYSRGGFSEFDQIQLKSVFEDLQKRGVASLLSNSDTPFIRNLYSEFSKTKVFASRTINSKISSRGKVAELIVRNYASVKSLQSAFLEKKAKYSCELSLQPV